MCFGFDLGILNIAKTQHFSKFINNYFKNYYSFFFFLLLNKNIQLIQNSIIIYVKRKNKKIDKIRRLG